MSIQNIEINKFNELLSRVGKSTVNALYPNEFEYYAITLELVDSIGDTVDFLTFPINPESIIYDDKSLVNIIQTAGGVTALDTDSFIPKNINLSGTFGRNFKLLIRKPESIENYSNKSFSNNLKRGYGVIKVLEDILNKSRGLDFKNKPYQLNLYNPALGHFYVVKYLNMKLQQDHKTSNMVWYYNLNLSCIGNLNEVKNDNNKSLKNNLKYIAQKSGINEIRKIKRTVF